MKHYLLLGAGFSRNWGGWLAAEAFEYLLGVPELQSRPSLIALLWKHQRTGGFEGALEDLQRNASRKRGDDLEALQLAVRQMFLDMNRGFVRSQFNIGQATREFLLRFDGIFTLNQDILLERQYWAQFPIGGGAKGWDGAGFPGVSPPQYLAEWEVERWSSNRWRVLPEVPNKLEMRIQPIIKLHGSSLWYRDEDQDGVWVLGGGKSGTISKDLLLSWYDQQFRDAIAQPDARLMIVGYGFRDGHINEAISAGAQQGLKVFNIGPDGANAWQEVSASAGPSVIQGANYLVPMLIGASRRSLLEILDEREIEHRKVMQFFEN